MKLLLILIAWLITLAQVAGYDSKEFANPEEWEKYRVKGAWLGCLMRNTDKEAGKAWPDPLNRTPKSARGPWTGNEPGGACFVHEHFRTQLLTRQ